MFSILDSAGLEQAIKVCLSVQNAGAQNTHSRGTFRVLPKHPRYSNGNETTAALGNANRYPMYVIIV